MITVDERSDGHVIALRLREVLTVTVVENPTTGYQWRLKSDGRPVVALTGDHFEPGEALLGRAGTRRWSFLAATPGEARIELVSTRAGSHDTPSDRTFAVVVRTSS